MARCRSAGFSLERMCTGIPRSLQALGSTGDETGPLDPARGVAGGLDPQDSQRYPTCHGFVFSGWQCGREAGRMGGLHTWWQI